MQRAQRSASGQEMRDMVSRRFVCGVCLGGVLVVSPAVARAEAAASLDAEHLPAAAKSETLLHVTRPGRFAITAHSGSGVALDLVDMITGPTDRAGQAGAADGRLDLLLDTGTYKLRTYAAPGAHGDVTLQAAPYRDIGSATALPEAGQVDAELADLQQRSFWLTVPRDQSVRLEAAGRALADLRLWRDGGQLVPALPDVRMIQPQQSHPLRDLRINAALPAGRYVVTAYGGPALPWADGQVASPFHLRTGLSASLAAGWVGGRIGTLGSEVFTGAGADDVFTLSMEGPATLTVDGQTAEIARNSRVPRADLRVASQPGPHTVEVTGRAGAAFQVQATSIGDATRVTQAGDYWLTANTTGLGGDEVPATLVLAREGPKGLAIIASTAPELATGAAWHQRFNLAGPVSVLFHVTQGGPLTVSLTGVPAAPPRLHALDAVATVPPESPGVWNLPAGWYALSVAPLGNAAGVADVSIGAPGVTTPVGPAGPVAPAISFGHQHLAWQGDAVESLILFSNTAPDAQIGLDARPLPVDLAARPLRVSQAAGEGLDIPVRPAPEGLGAVEIGRGEVPVTYVPDLGVARLPPPDHARVVALYRPPPPPASPATPTALPQPPQTPVQAGVPVFFNLAENRPKAFDVQLRQGGLYRVETLGRLHTRGAIGTDFVPELQVGEANGIGQNLLLQGFLRAGRYHVDVTATGSAGHAGLLATPAPLLTGASLVPGGSVRATLPAGSGLVVPVEIAAAGLYRLELLGLAHPLTARLEDAEGWPLMPAGPLSTTTQDLAPGHYRLLVSPDAVDTKMVARLALIAKPAPMAGHGPFPLPFGTVDYTWREPPGRNDPRVPDSWRFALVGLSDIGVTLSAGMEASLLAADGAQVAHIVGPNPFQGSLPAGAYRIEARSQGRNDRLDYRLSLTSTQLQPDVPRDVSLPAQLAFTLANQRVITLTSFGGTPVRATLRQDSGHGEPGRVLGRYGARDDDWNVATSRLLPPGAYTVDLAAAAPPTQSRTRRNINDVSAPASEDQPEDAAPDDAEAPPTDAPPAPDAGPQDMDGQAEPFPARAETPEGGNASQAAGHTEVTLSVPPEIPAVSLTAETVTLTGGGVHRLLLPAPSPGALILAGAASSAAVEVSLERQDQAGWHSVATAQGLAPVVALPADASPGTWRLSVWPVDPGAPAIRVAARVIAPATAPSSGPVHLNPTPLAGVSPDLAVACVSVPSRALLAISGQTGPVLVGAWPGHAAEMPNAGLIAAQDTVLWLVAPGPATLHLAPLPPGRAVTLTLAAGSRAALPRQPGPLTAWIAEAAGQPGLDAGHGMGVADGSAIALLSSQPATLWNAGDDDALRITAHPVALTMAASTGSGPTRTLPPATATNLPLPSAGPHRLRLDLPPGTAAVAGWNTPEAVTVWAGQAAISRTLEGNWLSLLLLNTGTDPASIGVAVDDIGSADDITPSQAVKRFFGAGGSTDLPVAAQPGQTLVVAGAASATFIGADGHVARGTHLPVTGPGRAVLDHGIGLVAAWLEGPGAAPWPAPLPVAVTLPATLPLAGPAMRVDLTLAQPALLRIRGTAPIILAVNDDAPQLYPAGAADSVYLPPGAARLRIISPQDGPLSGTIDLTATPPRAAAEGLGATETVAPGDAVAFAFSLPRAGRIGIGVRAQPDRATLRLVDARGRSIATGAAMLRDLPAGSYVLLAQVPADAPTLLIQPAIIGLTQHPHGPPADTVAYYRKLAGLTHGGNAP